MVFMQQIKVALKMYAEAGRDIWGMLTFPFVMLGFRIQEWTDYRIDFGIRK